LKIFKNITASEIFRITSLNGISVLLKIGIGLITSNVIANFAGAAGMALVGNFRNFITIIESIGLLGFQNGIVKYVAENEHDKLKLQKFLTTCVITISVVAILLSLGLYFFSVYLSQQLFGNSFEYENIIIATAVCIPWYLASLFLLNVLNGFGLYRKVISINIFGNVIGLLLSVVLIVKYSTFGALLSIILTPTILFFITLFYANKITPFLNISFRFFDFNVLKNLSEYSLMALFSSVIGSYVYLSIRNSVIDNLSQEKAGYWEAMTRISTYYLLFITTILSVYFLPKLSKSQTNEQTKAVFWSYYKGIIPVFILGLTILFFLKDFLVPILFSKEFQPTTSLFFWQLVGDVLKAVSLILGYQFFAKKLTKAFIITEAFSLAVLYCSSVYLISIFDIEGIVMAHAFTYFVYVIVLGIYFRKSIF
jgi:O-antigen/teichoic acid export membrane protein